MLVCSGPAQMVLDFQLQHAPTSWVQQTAAQAAHAAALHLLTVAHTLTLVAAVVSACASSHGLRGLQ